MSADGAAYRPGVARNTTEGSRGRRPVDLIEFCYEQGWTDGLPVVPPTQEKVAAAVAATGRRPDDLVCNYVERRRLVSVEHVAVNAVMAGCRPEYTPVVVAILEAMATDVFGIHMCNATTGGTAIAFVVNGPIRTRLEMNSRGNVFGPGNRANSTIGRAIRLVQINALGSVPGAGNEDRVNKRGPAHPGPSHHGAAREIRGLSHCRKRGGLPLAPTTARRAGVRPGPERGHRVRRRRTRADVGPPRVHPQGDRRHLVALPGSQWAAQSVFSFLLVIPPESAEIFTRDGWTKADIRQAVFEGTKRSVAWVKRHGWTLSGGLTDRRGGVVVAGDEDLDAAIAKSPDDILLVVAGGPAGAFVHGLHQYGGNVASQEIHLSNEE